MVVGQRPGSLEITRYIGRSLTHQTAGPLALSTIKKPETQPFRLGYVNCWAFGPISLVKFVVGNDTTESPKTHSAIPARLLRPMIFPSTLRRKSDSGF